VIGQAAEFDYAGTQACKSLREEGHEVVLINSNPATIMTDIGMSDALYIEPLTVEFCERVIAKERPDALLPTLGGQTGLNLATQLADQGILKKYNVKLLGTPLSAIRKAEDREQFRALMREIKEPVPESWIIKTPEELQNVLSVVPYPCIIRPAYTLGGTGGGVAETPEELWEIGNKGLKLSMRSQIMVERSLLGWKEVEYEVIRDKKGNCITVCNMENLDPMGVHTGDSIVIAPSQTLSDIEYNMLRTASLKIIQSLGIEGGCNVQLAVNPHSFDYYIIEVNPRVSRSSALASKATGYPIARVAAKIAIGKTLDEIDNQVTGSTKACFEPALDYCVVKIPRWPFDKFASGDRSLFTQMKATGEVMAIDRSFESALMKALRGLEVKQKDLRHARIQALGDEDLAREIRKPTDERLWALAEGLRRGWSEAEVNRIGKVDVWFLRKINNLLAIEKKLVNLKDHVEDAVAMRQIIEEGFIAGFPSASLVSLVGITPEFADDLRIWRNAIQKLPPEDVDDLARSYFTEKILALEKQVGALDAEGLKRFMEDRKREIEESESDNAATPDRADLSTRYDLDDPFFKSRFFATAVIANLKDAPVFKMVDTCAGEFESKTPYFYGTYEKEDDAKDDAREGDGRTVLVLGSGPIRIGQGIEFDYSCVHCVWSLKRLGYRAIIMNNNPETVSTDFDTGDGLYFEPVTIDDVTDVIRHENPIGVVVQFGGQTAINLAEGLNEKGFKVLGTSPAAIAAAEDRDQFEQLLSKLNIPKPDGRAVRSLAQARKVAAEIGYPILVRPSFVLGGRAMEIVYDESQLKGFYEEAEQANPGQPVLVDKYLLGKEAEVDVISDGVDTLVPGIMEHIERAGIHSGDSMAVYPAVSLSDDIQAQMVTSACKLARELGVKGLMNIQFVIQDEKAYVLEVNPRASRTVPYLSKVTGIPMVDLATRCMMGENLKDLGYSSGLWVPDGSQNPFSCSDDLNSSENPPPSSPQEAFSPIENQKSKIKNSRQSFQPHVSGSIIPVEAFENGTARIPEPHLFAVKAPVFSFQKLAKVEPSLGPEMKSTGEILGIDHTYVGALYKALVASGINFKGDGYVVVTVQDADKPKAIEISRQLSERGYKIAATAGTAKALKAAGIECTRINKIHEGSPNLMDLISAGEVSLMINTPSAEQAAESEGAYIRRACIETGAPCVTSIDTAGALAQALEVFRDPMRSSCLRLEEYFEEPHITAKTLVDALH
jgi:carbamoyl-phosphate synthase large subunit